MHISSITYTESESIESFTGYGLKKWVKREQSATVFLTDKDDENRADELAKQFVKEKLYGGKDKEVVQPETYSGDNLPEINVDKTEVTVNYDTVIQEINKCRTIKDLDEWNLIAKGNHNAGMAFSKKAAELLSPREPTLEEQIRSCKDKKVLKVYESMVKKDPILQKAYNDTMSAIELHNL